MSDSTSVSPEPTMISSGEPWTTRRLLAWMTNLFRERDVDSPRIVAEMLLSHVLQCDRLHLYMEVDRPATNDELATLRELTRRAADHEPVQHLVGKAWFFGREFVVNRSTLIPRPSTETLIERVLDWTNKLPSRHDLRMADIGTGTGCIAITLALQIPTATFVVTDTSVQAIELAKENADGHGVINRIEFRLGKGLDALSRDDQFHVICSNPPYVSDSEWNDVARNVKDFEPASALRAGTDGLDVIRPLIANAGEFLEPGGLLAVEFGHSQRDTVLHIAQSADWCRTAEVVNDHENLWRVLLAVRK